MPTLATTPSPAAFTRAATEGFEEALRSAAGRDGRLSRNEAARMAEVPDSVYGQSAVDVLERAGQKTMSVGKAVEAYRAHAGAASTDAAGNNALLSYAEGKTLPEDLQPAYLLLRGRGPVAKRQAFEAEIARVLETNGVWAPSLSAYPDIAVDDLPQPILDRVDRGFLYDFMLDARRIDAHGLSAYVLDIEVPMGGGFYRWVYDADGRSLDV
jgi:hypothetical protein